MEAVAAVGLVCNILQVSQYAFQIAAKGSEIRKSASGLTTEHGDLQTCTRELVARNERLQAQLRIDNATATSDEVDRINSEKIRDMGNKCEAAANDLINELRRIGIGGSTSVSKSYRYALKAVWGKDKVNALAARMKGFQEEINNEILVSLSHQQSILSLSVDTNFARLNESERQILEEVRNLPALTANQMSASVNFLAQLIEAGNARVLDRLSLSEGPLRSKGEDSQGAVDVSQMTIHEATIAGDLRKIRDVLVKDPGSVRAVDYEARTPLHRAAEMGNAHVVAYLLRKGADINTEDDDFVTPLHLAAKSGNGETFRLLLSKGAELEALDISKKRPSAYLPEGSEEIEWMIANGHNLESRDQKGNTALTHFVMNLNADVIDSLLMQGADANACGYANNPALWMVVNRNKKKLEAKQKAQLRIVSSLLKHGAKANANNNGSRRDTALTTSAWHGFTGAIRLLLEAGANPDLQNVHGFTALHEACEHKYEKAAIALIEGGANVLLKNQFDYEPMHIACREGLNDVFEALLKVNGTDVNRLGRDGWTPIAEASHHGHPAIVTRLLDLGADPNIKTAPHHGGYPSIALAAMNRRFQVIKILVTQGKVDVNCPGKDDWTALHEASIRGYTHSVKMLIEHGADTEAVNRSEGYTPLCMAAKYGKKDTVQTLVCLGSARLHPRTARNRDVPLMEAVKGGHTETVEVLLDLGSSISEAEKDQNDDCSTPLLGHAGRNGSVETAKVLIKHGADVNASNKDGYTALHEAAHRGNMTLARMLLEAGASKDARTKYGWNAAETARHFVNAATERELLSIIAELGV